eukprot:SAG25_NODE_161_length_13366_cov_13.111973_8_plen_215_part_00
MGHLEWQQRRLLAPRPLAKLLHTPCKNEWECRGISGIRAHGFINMRCHRVPISAHLHLLLLHHHLHHLHHLLLLRLRLRLRPQQWRRGRRGRQCQLLQPRIRRLPGGQNGESLRRSGCPNRRHSLVNCDHGDSIDRSLDSPASATPPSHAQAPAPAPARAPASLRQPSEPGFGKSQRTTKQANPTRQPHRTLDATAERGRLRSVGGAGRDSQNC